MSSTAFQPKRIALAGILGAVVLFGGAAAVGAFDREPVAPSTPSASARAASGVLSILCAAPFELDEPFPHDWSAERPLVGAGWLVTLEVDPDLVRPRQVAERVLQIGGVTLERINQGDESGRVIAIVPAPIDLFAEPAFFGAAALPEQVDLAARVRELDAARAADIEPFPTAVVQAALDCGGGRFELADRSAVLELAAQWILDHSPVEEDKAFRLLRLTPR
jgi:hypothetical protein